MSETTFKSKSGLFKCGTCLEVCAEPEALERAKAQRNDLLIALKAMLNCEYGTNEAYAAVRNARRAVAECEKP